MAAPPDLWSVEDEAQLQRLQQGILGPLEETAVYGDAVDTNNEFICVRLQAVSKARRKSILSNLFENLQADEKQDLLNELGGRV